MENKFYLGDLVYAVGHDLEGFFIQEGYILKIELVNNRICYSIATDRHGNTITIDEKHIFSTPESAYDYISVSSTNEWTRELDYK